MTHSKENQSVPKRQYAVTVVFYLHAEDEEHAENIVSHIVYDKILYKNLNESWNVVDTSEVKF